MTKISGCLHYLRRPAGNTACRSVPLFQAHMERPRHARHRRFIFFLALWGIIVCIATFVPLATIKNKPVARIVAFIGFMLTFGGWYLKWTIGGYLAYQAGAEACKQAGITIYVPPEKWREMVGGYEAWKELADYKSQGIDKIDKQKRFAIS